MLHIWISIEFHIHKLNKCNIFYENVKNIEQDNLSEIQRVK